jgi:regulator of protease activity HflC (stomatin/prohibitin superfamily)
METKKGGAHPSMKRSKSVKRSVRKSMKRPTVRNQGYRIIKGSKQVSLKNIDRALQGMVQKSVKKVKEANIQMKNVRQSLSRAAKERYEAKREAEAAAREAEKAAREADKAAREADKAAREAAKAAKASKNDELSMLFSKMGL